MRRRCWRSLWTPRMKSQDCGESGPHPSAWQDIFRQQPLRLFVHAFGVVVRAGEYDDHVELRKHGHLVAAVARHEVGGIRAVTRFEVLEPPEIAVLRLLIDLHVRRGRRLHPAFRYDALAVPVPTVQVELAELEQVAAFQLQSAAALRQPQRRIGPLNMVDSQRPEQVFRGKIRQLFIAPPSPAHRPS